MKAAELPVWERPIKMVYVDDEPGTQLHVSEENEPEVTKQEDQEHEVQTQATEAANGTREHSEMDMLLTERNQSLSFRRMRYMTVST